MVLLVQVYQGNISTYNSKITQETLTLLIIENCLEHWYLLMLKLT